MAYLLLAPLLAVLLSFVLTPLARRLALWVGAVDRPGPRKVHLTEVPRLGGLAVIASGFMVAGLLYALPLRQVDRIADDLAAGLTIGLIPVLVCSIIDDLSPLKALPKFLAQFLGAALAVGFGIRLDDTVHLFAQDIHLGWLAIPLSLLWIVGVTNAFNIVDGLDGLAAGLALGSAVSLAATALLVGQFGLSMLGFVLAGALAGFLPYNIHPAKIFLGDSGATTVGFTLACLALRGGSTLSSGLAILAPVLVLGLPIAETLVSMVRRVVRGLRSGGKLGVFEADAGHFHHRLLALGLDKRKAVLVLYLVGMIPAVTGYLSLFLTHKKAAVVLLTMLVAAFIGVWQLGYDEFAFLRRGDLLRMYEVPVLRTRAFLAFIDIAIVVLAIYVAFVLKYDDWGLTTNRRGATWLMAVFPPVSLAIFSAFGLYRRVWRFATSEDLLRTSVAATACAALVTGLSILFIASTPPITWFATCYLVLLIGLNGTRASHRLLHDTWRRSQMEGEPVLVYGAGFVGSSVVRELFSKAAGTMRPVGFIDDHPDRSGKVFSGFPVLGSVEALEALIPRFGIRGVIVASDKVLPDRLRLAARICERSGVWMRKYRVGFEEGSGAHDPNAVAR